MDYLADLYFTYLSSNQPIEGSIIVNDNNSFFPLGVFIVNYQWYNKVYIDSIPSYGSLCQFLWYLTIFLSNFLAYLAFMKVLYCCLYILSKFGPY
jgi:hypothetical protein